MPEALNEILGDPNLNIQTKFKMAVFTNAYDDKRLKSFLRCDYIYAIDGVERDDKAYKAAVHWESKHNSGTIYTHETVEEAYKIWEEAMKAEI